VAGKPYTVSEFNHPFPNEYACEGLPILAAYAAMQDWDGVFAYTLAHRAVITAEPMVAGHFDFAHDPIKMSQMAAGALLFLRGDVQPARHTVSRSYSREQVVESIRLPSAEQPYFTPGFPLALPLQQAMRVTSFDGPATGRFEAAAGMPIRSDTGELAWFHGATGSGLVTVNTARSQALIGFCRGSKEATENLALEPEVPFCAVTLGALDDQPIAKSGRLLLTAAARMANSGMEWNEKRTSLITWGKAPTVVEPVSGRVTLKQMEGARSIECQPLDGAGRPLGRPIAAHRSGSDWTVVLGEPATTWFVVSVAR
jgi:hypothetical protein